MPEPKPEENGLPEKNALPAFPRIAPPDGVRLARGQKIPDLEDDATLSEPPNTSFLLDTADFESPADGQDRAQKEESLSEELDSTDLRQSDARWEDENETERFRHTSLRDDTPKDAELGLLEHLGELRTRLMWCFAIIGVGMAITWNLGLTLQEWFAAPITAVLQEKGKLISRGPTDFFTIYLEFSLVSALILTAPLLFFQIWRFVEPALTHSERRYTLVLVPFSSVLFFLGAGLGYLVSPLFFQFFLAFQPGGVAADWDYKDSVMLMAKMLLVFGIAFQVPIIVIFGVKIGILTRDILIQYWRHAVIVIFTIIAILTPTWDPLTLAICATPPCLLYVLSIWLVKWM